MSVKETIDLAVNIWICDVCHTPVVMNVRGKMFQRLLIVLRRPKIYHLVLSEPEWEIGEVAISQNVNDFDLIVVCKR